MRSAATVAITLLMALALALPAAAIPQSPIVAVNGPSLLVDDLTGTAAAAIANAVGDLSTGGVQDRPYSTQQSSGFFSPASDYCGDHGAAADVWQMGIATDANGTLLFTRHCSNFSPPTDFANGAVTLFQIDGGLDRDGSDFIVGFGASDESPSGIGVVVFRTPDNNNQGTWSVLVDGPAQQPAADEYGAYIPPGVIPFNQFFYYHGYVAPGGSTVDRTPEDAEASFAPLFHPNVCAGGAFGGFDAPPSRTASLRGDLALLDIAADLLADAGVPVLADTVELGFLGVNAAADDPRVTSVAARLLLDVSPSAVHIGLGQVPNDPRFTDQWALAQVGASEAWDATTTGGTIAVIDSGLDGGHADLNVASLYNSLTGTTGSQSNARGFHGTAVASVAAAATDNSQFGAGVTWGQPVIGINTFDANGCATGIWIADGIRAAVDRGAEVINLSLGGSSETDPDIASAIDYAVGQGVLVIAASGNSGAAEVSYPASDPDVIAVGATDRTGQVSSYSQTGPQIDVVAPGGGTSGEDADGIYAATDNHGEIFTVGTSFASPMVAGAASLWLAGNPGGTVNDFRAALAASADDIGQPGKDSQSGNGILNLPGLIGDVPPGPTPPPAGPPPSSGSTDTGNLWIVDGYDPAGVAGFVNIVRFFGSGTTPRHAVLAREDVFADSLAGTALTTDGPLLYTNRDSLDFRSEIELEDLAAGSTVYLLGGPAAISSTVEQEVRDLGFNPVRLSGASRIDTAIAIADEAVRLNPAASEVAIARADNWADSVTAGAWAAKTGQPILITPTDALHPSVASWLSRFSPDRVHVLGGPAAVSDTTLSQIRSAAPGATVARVAGAGRDTTATAIAEQLLPGYETVVVVPGYDDQGWVPGLAAAGLGASEDAILVLAGDTVPNSTRAVLAATDACYDVTVVHLDDQLPDTVLGDIAEVADCR